MNKKLSTILLLFMVISAGLSGQSVDELLQKAYLHYNEKNYDLARIDIDQAVSMRKGEERSLAWHIRGFIYKDIYLQQEKGNKQSEARNEAVKSFERSLLFDSAGEYTEMNHKALKAIAISFWNDASELIDSGDTAMFDRATNLYDQYRSLHKLIYPDSSLVEKDVQLYLAFATAHRRIYESDREANEAHWHKSNDYLKKTLTADPLNFDAYYSLAVSHYNRGASNLERLPEIEAISDIYKVQGESMRSIQGALPFMMKAYEIDPERIEAVKGLKWITWNLHLFEESEGYDQKLNNMQKEEFKR